MMHLPKPATILVVTAVSVPGLVQSAAGQCRYELVSQPGVSCGVGSRGFHPRGMNEHGLVVGYMRSCNLERSFVVVWDGGPDFTYLDLPWTHPDGAAYDVNDAGHITGSMWSEAAVVSLPSAFYYDGQDFVEIEPMPGGDFSDGVAINEHDQVTGSWGDSVNGPVHGFVWQSGVMTDLGPTIGAEFSLADDINDLGAVTGRRWLESRGIWTGFVWQDGVVIDMGPIPGGRTSEPSAINNRGEVVGSGILALDRLSIRRAFLWRSGEMTMLRPLPGHPSSGAQDINDHGQVVGYSGNQTGGNGVLWQHGRIFDLNDLVPPGTPRLGTAKAINNAGEIATDSGNTVVRLFPVNRPPTDLNIDCRTDRRDLIVLIESWGQPDSPADFNSDGTVNVFDLLILLAEWDGEP